MKVAKPGELLPGLFYERTRVVWGGKRISSARLSEDAGPAVFGVKRLAELAEAAGEIG
jgi:hypothetical protein